MNTAGGPSGPGDGGAGDRRIGAVLQGRYRILARIADGGMATVYRGERLQLGRPVAVKFLHPAMAKEAQFVRRFEVEARAMSRLAHPNCIAVIDFGTENEAPYLVMDYVQGTSMRTLLDEGALPVHRALRIARQVLAALVHAHAHAIIHRDIKPENIVVEQTAGLEDHVRVLDFGLAKLRDSASELTRGLALGTPNYMAPELMVEGPVDERVDIYAVGLLLFELLTGKQPFDAPELGEVLRRQREMAPPLFRTVAPDRSVSPALEAVVRRALEKAPVARFPSAAVMAAALEEVPEAKAGVAGEPRRTRAAPALPAPTATPVAPADQTVFESVPFGLHAELASRSKKGNQALRLAVEAIRWIRASRRRMIVGAAASFVAVAGLAAAALSSGEPASPPEQPSAEPGPAHPSLPARANVGAPMKTSRAEPESVVPAATTLAEVEALAAGGERNQAIAKLVELRRRQPRDPDYAATLARLYFEKGSWSAGVSAFRVAIRHDPKRREDTTLIRGTIDGLQSDRLRDDAEDLLRDLGSAAKSHVKEAAKSHPKRTVRARAADLLRHWNRRPFLRFR